MAGLRGGVMKTLLSAGKVCWWQLAMAGLCGVVEWAMEGACVHLVSTSGVLGFALSRKCTCSFRLWEHLGKLGLVVLARFFLRTTKKKLF